MEERILDLSYGRKDLGSILWKKGSWIYPMEERIRLLLKRLRILDLSYGRKDLGSIPWKKGSDYNWSVYGSWIYPMEERILDISPGRKDLGSILWKKGSDFWISLQKQRNWATNYIFIIPISLQPDDVNLWNFKLTLFDLTS